MKRNAKILFLLSMIVMMILAGCQSKSANDSFGGTASPAASSSGSSGGSSGGDKITLTFWLRDTRESNLKAMEEIIALYESQHPNIKIDVVQTPWSSAEQQVATAIASKTLPDLSQLSQTGAADYGAKGILLNLDDKFKETDFSNVTDLSMWQAMYQGVHYAVPWFAGSNVLFYNKDLFEEAGIVDENGEAKPPTTWDEFLDYAQKLTKDTNGDGQPDQWGFVLRGNMDNNQTVREFMLAAGGGEFLDANENVIIDTPENLKGLQFYLDLYQKYKVVPPDTLSIDGSAEEQKFLSGKIGMMFNGPWNLGVMKNSSFEWGVALEPKSAKNASHIGGCPVGIFATTKHPEEAWDFATFLLSDEAQRIWSIKYGNGLPATKTIQQEAKADPIIKVFVEGLEAAQADGVTPPPQSPKWTTIDRTIAPHIWQQALLGELTAEEALKRLQKEVETLMSNA